MTRAVPRGPDPGCHGISANVSMSGIRYWSRLGDPGEALDRRAVEPGPVLDRALELVDRDRDRLDVADDVGELELDEADAALLGGLDLGCGVLVGHGRVLLSSEPPGRLAGDGRAGEDTLGARRPGARVAVAYISL